MPARTVLSSGTGHAPIALIKMAAMHRSKATGSWLALVDDFRTINWLEVYKYPEVILSQMRQLLRPIEV